MGRLRVKTITHVHESAITDVTLSIADFYYELGVQCVESCMILRNSVGPLMEVQVLRHHVQARAP